MQRRDVATPVVRYQHYCRLSLSQFYRGDFLLMLNHVDAQKLGYKNNALTPTSTTTNQSSNSATQDATNSMVASYITSFINKQPSTKSELPIAIDQIKYYSATQAASALVI